MLPQTQMFEYRAWPSERTPHAETLHHLFGVGLAEIRTDTYLLTPRLPRMVMVVRGGTHLEIKEKISDLEPAAAWIVRGVCAFPLRRSVVKLLQSVFPDSKLPARISAPVDLISWVGNDAFVWNVSKRIVQFNHADCTAELAVVNAHGRRAETFCVKAKQHETVSEILRLMPAHRLPNLDYGAWLEPQVRHNRRHSLVFSPQVLKLEKPLSTALQRLKRSVISGKRWLEQHNLATAQEAPGDSFASARSISSVAVFPNSQMGSFRMTGTIHQPHQCRRYLVGGCYEGDKAGDHTLAAKSVSSDFSQKNISIRVSAPDRVIR